MPGTPSLRSRGFHAFKYVDCDVPDGMTLDEYRRRRVRPGRPGLVARMRFWRH
jgi:hypothetical protein